MIYLAQPYSHPDEKIMHQRYLSGLYWCHKLRDRYVYSPIVHWHNVAIAHSMPTEATFWLDLNFHMIELSRAMYVLQLDGWQDSKGLYEEVNYCEKAGKATFAIRDGEIYSVTPRALLKELAHHGDNHKKRVIEFTATKGNVKG